MKIPFLFQNNEFISEDGYGSEGVNFDSASEGEEDTPQQNSMEEPSGSTQKVCTCTCTCGGQPKVSIPCLHLQFLHLHFLPSHSSPRA